MVALLLVGLWAFGRGDLPATEATIRAESFIWPAVETAVGLGVVVALTWMHRRSDTAGDPQDSSRATAGRLAGVSLLVCETAFLVAAGAPLWTSSSTPFASTPAVVALKSAVGSSVVGLGGSLCFLPPGLGIPENAQVAYGVQELALYDPMIPSAYYSSWRAVSRESPGIPDDSVYCPGINTAKLARLYGVSFVLERAGSPGPQGGVFDRAVGDEDLYRIPDAGVATLTPLAVDGRLPADDAPGTPVTVTHPDPSSWKLRSDADGPQVLRLRLTDVPGWHASIDGRPVPLRALRRADAPGRGAGRAPHHRAVLLAGNLHRRSRPGRVRGRRSRWRLCRHMEPRTGDTTPRCVPRSNSDEPTRATDQGDGPSTGLGRLRIVAGPVVSLVASTEVEAVPFAGESAAASTGSRVPLRFKPSCPIASVVAREGTTTGW